jgi:hypothetical protein
VLNKRKTTKIEAFLRFLLNFEKKRYKFSFYKGILADLNLKRSEDDRNLVE